jgi:hypothetical protein
MTASLAVRGIGYVRPYTGTLPVLVLDWQVLFKDRFVTEVSNQFNKIELLASC